MLIICKLGRATMPKWPLAFHPWRANQATRCHGRQTRASLGRRLESLGRARHVPDIPSPTTGSVS
ncbi:hypothetical protein CORC01_04151 [Colletotrichum orchidophilum]|uniref:Uncharacterized protein n=1 Tax=Colletotrichum orchidophilum TaxID=1209926 RepID=A0A1G4BGP9_9PEZI|nr:uncharacterized protein CORC01_04151 [Colletotrichum orchidophilum]OHF00612.1 hypothetical protein CORC01_04151 [Colletotrichum orchidophilum]